MVNFPKQQKFLDVSVTLGRAVTLCVQPKVRVQVLVETTPSCGQANTASVDARLVIDRSSSMSQQSGDGGRSKIELAKEALIGFGKELRFNDVVLLASFNHEARLDCEHRRLGRTHFSRSDRLEKAIAKLETSGDTHISDALEMALVPKKVTECVPRVFLFTDGESTTRPAEDHARLVELADLARTAGIPLAIYGTGVQYNWSLLQQLAIRVGNGSFCKHVMSVDELKNHLLGELAYMRGTAIEGLKVTGVALSGARIVGVTAMSPTIRSLPLREDRAGTDYFIPRQFSDSTGSLDIHRGQQYLIDIEIDRPRSGDLEVLRLRFDGRILASREEMMEIVTVSVSFTDNASEESVVDERVKRVVLMMAGAKAAEAGRYDHASGLFTRAGDPKTAEAMATLHQMSEGRGPNEDYRRTACTNVGDSVSETLGPNTRLGRDRGGK